MTIAGWFHSSLILSLVIALPKELKKSSLVFNYILEEQRLAQLAGALQNIIRFTY